MSALTDTTQEMVVARLLKSSAIVFLQNMEERKRIMRQIDFFEAWAAFVSLDLSKDAEGYYKSESTGMAFRAWFAAQVEIPVEVQEALTKEAA